MATFWALARLARNHEELEVSVTSLLDERLGAHRVDAEASFLRSHPAFERPHGWVWLLVMQAELLHHDGDLAAALEPLVERLWVALTEWLPYVQHPNRSGGPDNTAFALLLARHAAERTGRQQRLQQVISAARRLHLHDAGAAAVYEPGHGDRLSPILTEAHLMAEVLGSDRDFADWYESFLPGTAEVIPPSLREPPIPGDPLHGWRHELVLMRAWSWRSVARSLPSRDERRVAALDAADAHLAAGLEVVPDETSEVGALYTAVLAVLGL